MSRLLKICTTAFILAMVFSLIHFVGMPLHTAYEDTTVGLDTIQVAQFAPCSGNPTSGQAKC